jgi:hypothetical protein
LQSGGGYIIIYSEVIVKKILIFCLYCVVFTLLPAVSILAQGGKDNSKAKPFPVLEVPVEEGETFYLSDMTSADDDTDETSLVPETTAVNKGEDTFTPEITTVNENKAPSAPVAAPVNEYNPPAPQAVVVNENKAPPAPVAAPVNEYNPPAPKAAPVNGYNPPVPVAAPVIDRPSHGSADANTTTTASAAESAAAAAQSAAAAAQSARVAESAAATATAAAASVSTVPRQPSPSQPPAVQPQPASPRAPPQPPARTVVPTVNIIVPQTAPPVAAPSAAPPAYRPSMNVTPGMPDPYSNGVYRVQVGSFSNTGLAQQCFNRLKAAGLTPFYEQYGSLYRVVISGIQAADMAGVIRRLETAGFTDAWIREER